MLAEGDEQPVDLYPVLLRQFVLEGAHRLLRGRCRYVAPPVGHSPHMHIDADPRLATSNPEREIGALRPDSLERGKHVRAARQLAAEFGHGALRDFANL